MRDVLAERWFCLQKTKCEPSVGVRLATVILPIASPSDAIVDFEPSNLAA
jgi:hypothetical protein